MLGSFSWKVMTLRGQTRANYEQFDKMHRHIFLKKKILCNRKEFVSNKKMQNPMYLRSQSIKHFSHFLSGLILFHRTTTIQYKRASRLKELSISLIFPCNLTLYQETTKRFSIKQHNEGYFKINEDKTQFITSFFL